MHRNFEHFLGSSAFPDSDYERHCCHPAYLEHPVAEIDIDQATAQCAASMVNRFTEITAPTIYVEKSFSLTAWAKFKASVGSEHPQLRKNIHELVAYLSTRPLAA